MRDDEGEKVALQNEPFANAGRYGAGTESQ